MPVSQQVSLCDVRGQARVEGIALESYLGWQHTKMNPLVFNRIGFVALVAAFESGWLDRQGNFFTLAKYEAEPIRKNSAEVDEQAAERALVEAQHQFSTVFVASIATELNHDSNLSLKGRSEGAVAELSVAHVGSSSFTLRVELSCNDESFGSMLLSFVHVDFKARRPARLPEAKRVSLDDAKTKNALQTGSTPAAMQRLALAQLFQSVAEQLTHTKTFALRHSDFDFNLHLNQSMYQSFAVDTLKEAAMFWASQVPEPSVQPGDGSVSNKASWVDGILSALRGPPSADEAEIRRCIQTNTLILDAAIHSLQMDYLREIQMPAVASAVVPGVACHISPIPEEPNSFLFCIRLDTDEPKDVRSAGVIKLNPIS